MVWFGLENAEFVIEKKPANHTSLIGVVDQICHFDFT